MNTKPAIRITRADGWTDYLPFGTRLEVREHGCLWEWVAGDFWMARGPVLAVEYCERWQAA